MRAAAAHLLAPVYACVACAMCTSTHIQLLRLRLHRGLEVVKVLRQPTPHWCFALVLLSVVFNPKGLGTLLNL